MNLTRAIGAVICAMFLSISITQDTLASENINFKVYTTSKVIDGQPTPDVVTDFDCSDRIYLVLEAQGLEQKKHQLAVKWFNPVNEQQELTKYKFDGHPYSRVWAWLQLSGPPGAVIGQVFDPAFGMEDFIGKWQVQVLLNSKKLDQIEFNVLC